MKIVHFYLLHSVQANFSKFLVLLMLCFYFILPFSALAQGRGPRTVPTPPANRLADSLVVAWHLAQLSADSSQLNMRALSAQLRTDTASHYPYYALTDTLALGSHVQLRIEQLPKKGYLYYFSVDARQTTRLLWQGSLDSLRQQHPNGILPDSSHAYVFEHLGTEYLCLWYSLQPIAKYEQLAQGIELTYGTFMERTAMQLNKKMPAPTDSLWQLSPQKIALTLPTDSTHATQIMPIVLACKIAKTASKIKTPTKATPEKPKNQTKPQRRPKAVVITPGPKVPPKLNPK